MNSSARELVTLDSLVRLFHDAPHELGRFEEVTASAMPAVYRELLAHEHHMTVTVEAHHRSPVDVEVLSRHSTPTHYAREILLRRRSDRQVVQFGIMRLNLSHLSEQVRAEVESETVPLGHVLIRFGVLRSIHVASLWRVTPGPRLAEWFGLVEPRITYGRTALIHCDDGPVVELLEVVTPSEPLR